MERQLRLFSIGLNFENKIKLDFSLYSNSAYFDNIPWQWKHFLKFLPFNFRDWTLPYLVLEYDFG